MHGGMIDRYILNEAGEPVAEPDLMAWGRWFETAGRHLADDEVGDVRVSTVFLGLDHRFGDGPPVLWETMVFGAPKLRELFGRERMIRDDLGDQFDQLGQRRYTSRAEALQGHAEALAAVHRLRGLLANGPGEQDDDRAGEHPEPDQGGGTPAR
jgi:hypothetical protein